MAIEYHRKNHCKYMIKLHMIFVVKYRKPLLVGDLGEDIKQIMFDISKKDDSKFSVDTMEVDRDHLYVLLDIEPTVSVVSIVNRLKSMSTGDACMETTKKYIEEHG